ncbi:hypothetical protein [Endozoicomonas sp. ONNA1]|uniref:hypothetical protein n=1 Tax=Endozoicomonas sp. ONNA1 TaxID=2828740 RepID=UPI00214812F5|nr:hypothetical protein [Endozoicomonas sp. ONNA1]
MENKAKPIKGYECINVTYSKSSDGRFDDLLCVKENIHYQDGTIEPNLRLIKNFKRDFYVTRKGQQTHQQKREYEAKKNLQRYECTQAELELKVSRVLNGRPNARLKELARSPYLYGVDVTSSVILKQNYRERWPDLVSMKSLAVLDYETDVLNGTEEIITGALTFKNKVKLVVTKGFIDEEINFEKRFKKLYHTHLKSQIEDRKLELDYLVVDTPAQVVMELMEAAHEWKPDYIGVWNLNFDAKKMIDALDRENIDPASVFCDPKIPPRLRHFYYKEAPRIKVTATGKKFSKHTAELWHVLSAPASFQFVDCMSLYCLIRLAAGKKASYSLDSILNEEIDMGKLHFDNITDGYTGIEWHIYMQKKFKAEYLVYNIFDCIGVELLDEKTNDVSMTLSTLLGNSEFSQFSSNPRRLCNDLHFSYLKEDNVIMSTSDQMSIDLDKHIYSMNNWIVTLPPYMLADGVGINAIEDMGGLKTNVFFAVADLDVAGSYPNTEDFLNMSKETTEREFCKLEGINESVQRVMGLNITAATTNAIEIANDVMGMPTLDHILEEFIKDTDAQLK